MNTLANSDTPSRVPVDLPQRTINQASAAMALMTLMAPGIDAPAAYVHMDPAWRVEVHVHDDPEGFEWWREALGLDPAAAGAPKLFDGYCTIRIPGQIDSTDVCLVGYLPLPAGTAAAPPTTETGS